MITICLLKFINFNTSGYAPCMAGTAVAGFGMRNPWNESVGDYMKIKINNIRL